VPRRSHNRCIRKEHRRHDARQDPGQDSQQARASGCRGGNSIKMGDLAATRLEFKGFSLELCQGAPGLRVGQVALQAGLLLSLPAKMR
jgi:hypothetical protein